LQWSYKLATAEEEKRSFMLQLTTMEGQITTVMSTNVEEGMQYGIHTLKFLLTQVSQAPLRGNWKHSFNNSKKH
jgi:hypothetical protein